MSALKLSNQNYNTISPTICDKQRNNCINFLGLNTAYDSNLEHYLVISCMLVRLYYLICYVDYDCVSMAQEDDKCRVSYYYFL